MNWRKICHRVPSLGLVYAGVLLLAAGWPFGLLDSNLYLLLCLCLVLFGVVLYVWRLKKESRY